jgi:hypothetical protein
MAMPWHSLRFMVSNGDRTGTKMCEPLDGGRIPRLNLKEIGRMQDRWSQPHDLLLIPQSFELDHESRKRTIELRKQCGWGSLDVLSKGLHIVRGRNDSGM